MTSPLIQRLKRRLLRRPADVGPPAWQRVESGLLAGLELYLPADRRPASWIQRICRGDYERELVGELADLAVDGGVFYDVGGHAGLFSCAWLHLGGTRVEVFEPSPENSRRIEETLARNVHRPAARVHRLALADYDGKAVLIQNATDIGLASMSYVEGLGGLPKMRRQSTNTQVDVEVRRLDSLVETLRLPAPRVVKIDVEGGEENVVRGASDVLAAARPVVFCEMHTIASAVGTTARLGGLGYDPAPLEAVGAGMPIVRFDPSP